MSTMLKGQETIRTRLFWPIDMSNKGRTSLNPVPKGGQKGMEVTMSDKDTNYFEHEVGEAVTKLPPVITTIIAVEIGRAHV